MSDEWLNQWRSELQQIRNAVSEAPNDEARAEALRRLASLYRRADTLIGGATVLRDEVRAAAELLRVRDRRAVPPPSDADPVREDRLGASTYIEKGWHLITMGDYPGAIQALQRALELAPGESQGGALLGWAQVLDGEPDQALATLAGVLERDPNHALARVNVGLVCLKQRNFGEAIEHLSRVIRDQSDRKALLYAHYYLGMVYFERGMFGDAVPFFEQALDLGPNLAEARYELGRALWFADQPDAARSAWRVGASTTAFSAWGTRCREMLTIVDAGGEVPRTSLV